MFWLGFGAGAAVSGLGAVVDACGCKLAPENAQDLHTRLILFLSFSKFISLLTSRLLLQTPQGLWP